MFFLLLIGYNCLATDELLNQMTQMPQLNNQNIQYQRLNEFTIEKPLTAEKRFLGWYLDGSWAVNEKSLNFGEFSDESFLLTNTLIASGSRIVFFNRIAIESGEFNENRTKNQNFVFGLIFSSHLIDVVNFDNSSRSIQTDGIGVFFMIKENKQTLYLKKNNVSQQFSLPSYLSKKLKKAYLRQYQFLDKVLDIQVNFDFPNNLFEFFINKEKIFETNISKMFNEKVMMSLFGYSTQEAPINLAIEQLDVFKAILPDQKYDEQNFHYNVQNFAQSVTQYDKLHSEQASYSNILLIDGRIEQELETTQNLQEVMAERQKVIQNNMDDFSGQGFDHFKTKDIQEELQEIMKNIYNYDDMNRRLAEEVGQVSKKFESVERITQLSSKMKIMQMQLQDMNDFLNVYDTLEALKKLENSKEEIKKGGLEKIFELRQNFMEQLTNGDFVGNNSMKVFIFYVIVIGVMIFLLVFKLKKQEINLD